MYLNVLSYYLLIMIYIAGVGSILLIIYTISACSLKSQYRQTIKASTDEKYDEVIKSGEYLLKAFPKSHMQLFIRLNYYRIESLHLALAISYFVKSENDRFLEHINALKQHADDKEFWLALFWLREGDVDTANLHYRNLGGHSEKTETYRTYFESLRAYRQGDCEAAKEKMQSIYQNLHYPLLKSYADEILN